MDGVCLCSHDKRRPYFKTHSTMFNFLSSVIIYGADQCLQLSYSSQQGAPAVHIDSNSFDIGACLWRLLLMKSAKFCRQQQIQYNRSCIHINAAESPWFFVFMRQVKFLYLPGRGFLVSLSVCSNKFKQWKHWAKKKKSAGKAKHNLI